MTDPHSLAARRIRVCAYVAKVPCVLGEAGSIFTQFAASNLEVPGVQACLAV